MSCLDSLAINNLANDDRFASLIKETGDIHYWMNIEQYDNALGRYMSEIKLSVLPEGNAQAMRGNAISFDNGKITMKSKNWYNKELYALMKKHAGRKK